MSSLAALKVAAAVVVPQIWLENNLEAMVSYRSWEMVGHSSAEPDVVLLELLLDAGCSRSLASWRRQQPTALALH